MKAFVAVSSLLGLAAAEADPLYAAPVLPKAYPSWPGVVAPGFESTCYGCGLGKRSADAEPEAWAPLGLWGPGIAAHPTGFSYSNRSPQGLGKREADAEAYGYGYPLAYGVAPGVNAHPTGISFSSVRLGKREAAPWGLWGPGIAAHPTGFSYTNRSPQGAYGKRSADAAPWGLWGPGIAAHPTGTSYTFRSPQGAYGKRSADAAPWGLWGPGIAAHPTGTSYTFRSPQGAYGKRSADAEPLYTAPVLPKAYPSWPGVVAPGFESTCFGCGLGKREAGEEEGPAKALHPNGATSYVGRTVWGFPLKEVEKREAGEEEVPAKGLHPNGATSYVGRTVWGFPLKEVEKREAEPLAIGYTNRSPQGAYGWAPYW